MKKAKYIMRGVMGSLCLLIFSSLLSMISCSEDHADLRPGLWTSEDVIDTYPGDTILIEGQASCYTGLQSISITCNEWEVNKQFDLSNENPSVFNFRHTILVPTDAEFDQNLLITVTDKNGSEQKKVITMKYVPATEAPYIAGLNTEIAVNYDTSTGLGVYELNAAVCCASSLDKAVLRVPALGIDETIPLSGSTAQLQKRMEFHEAGTYPMTIIVSDRSGNTNTYNCTLYVIPEEHEDEVEDYPMMFAFMGNEKADDYIYGYYQYMQRMDDGCYQVSIYAPSDDTEYFFSPTRNDNGDRRFGISPFISTKLISKQSEPGYVKGYKPGKGYWGLWVDVKSQTIIKWALDTSTADKGTLYYSADWNGWTFTEMASAEAEYQKTGDITIYAGNQYFCFATTTDWTHIWRIWNDGGDIAGWWFSEDGSGSGATLPVISADVNATITFDTATKWCFIKKR